MRCVTDALSHTFTTQVWKVSYPEQRRHIEREAAHERQAASCSYAPEPPLFHRLFPYHFVLDKDLKVVQVGVQAPFQVRRGGGGEEGAHRRGGIALGPTVPASPGAW